MKATLWLEWAYDCWFSDKPYWYVIATSVPAPVYPVAGISVLDVLDVVCVRDFEKPKSGDTLNLFRERYF